MSSIPVTFCDTLGCNLPSGEELLHKVIERWERAEKESERDGALCCYFPCLYFCARSTSTRSTLVNTFRVEGVGAGWKWRWDAFHPPSRLTDCLENKCSMKSSVLCHSSSAAGSAESSSTPQTAQNNRAISSRV